MSYSKAATISLKLPAQPIHFFPVARAKATPARAIARRRAAAPAAFGEMMELGLTTLIFAAVFLFGAGLLQYGVPACQARRIGVLVLDGGAGALIALTILVIARGLAQLVRARSRIIRL